MLKKSSQLVTLAWAVTGLVTLLAFIAWGQYLGWDTGALSSYTLFPLFGLLAFSIMWAHYIVAALRIYSGHPKDVTKQYFNATSFVVLLAICLHPGILIWQLWRDGFGLPPNSYLTYVGPALKGAVALGSVSLLIFLAYEFHRVFAQKPWWKYVQYLSDIAMIAILFHSLKLGSHVQSGWFQVVWFTYGITLVLAMLYMYLGKQKTAAK